MIAIVSSNPRERSALAAVCESRQWPHDECDSLKSARRLLDEAAPRVIIARAKLIDGFFEELIVELPRHRGGYRASIILLIEAGSSSAHEARQISLGATTVLRDPVRTEVLVAYAGKYLDESVAAGRLAAAVPGRKEPLQFARATVHPLERRVENGRHKQQITPREVQLLKLLAEAEGRVVTYHMLYSDILGRKFRGDSSNMRVLLRKLHTSFGRVGIRLRDYITVISKTGYRYDARESDQGAEHPPH